MSAWGRKVYSVDYMHRGELGVVAMAELPEAVCGRIHLNELRALAFGLDKVEMPCMTELFRDSRLNTSSNSTF